MSLKSEFLVRDARDDDAAGLIELIGNAYAEYPGCVLDVDREEPDLRAIATSFARKGGGFWVVEQRAPEQRTSSLVGSAGWLPSAAHVGWIDLRKLYVAKAFRRRGVARALCGRVEELARARGAIGISLWSDTRFVEAHQFYRVLGYTQQSETRDLHDLSNTTEYRFTKIFGE
ncbi:MAG TPA: GNAT family N-acetyltransferase [Polyangiaceae bacterium]|nr:GNAT family N-acetyltransferase [Polyangiaceae bacterium]